MEMMECLLSRRSIRQYTNQPVEDKQIYEIIKAGMYAPSARNQQIWRFIVIHEPKKMQHISTNLKTASMAKYAPFAIVVCADTSKATSAEFWDQDCSAAVENIMLAAHDKGLGTVWVGLHPHPERVDVIRRLCVIPENIQVHSLIVGGYPDEHKENQNRYHPEYISDNTWKM